MRVGAVFFDIGGVLEITPDTGWRKKWDGRAFDCPELEEVWRAGSIGRMALDEVERRIAEILRLDRTGLEEFMADLWAEYLGELNVELTAYFRALRPQYRTGIISNSFVGATEREEARYRFSSVCDDVVYSHEVGIAKPDQRIFELALSRLGVRPEESVFLDDLAVHVEAARSLGMKAVLYESNAQAIREIQAHLAA
jgi:epoxide hydrolase-like predicted phosphatase